MSKFALFLLVAAALIYWALKKRVNSAVQIELSQPTHISAIQYASLLAMMDEIDCAILSNAKFSQVLDLLFAHLPKYVPCKLLAVSQLAITDESGMQVLTQDGRRHQYKHQLDKSFRKLVTVEPNGLWLESVKNDTALSQLQDLGAQRLLVLPVFRDAELSALLTIGFDDNAQLTDEMQRIVRYLADRLGVVLTMVVRADSLYYQENFDAVTRLPNRRACRAHLAIEIARAQRYKLQLAVLYINLDGFKKVNEVAGYAIGDVILKQIGQRIRMHLREPDLTSRFGDDEFVVILADANGTSGVSKVAEKLIAFLSQPFSHDDHSFYLNASVGISMFPEDGLVVDLLIQSADTAMATVKAKGNGQFMFHEAHMNTLAYYRLSLERDLRSALSKNELFLQYQPQIDLLTGKLVGAEALVRWQHPTRGVIPPIEFINIAEESGLIEQLGEYVRRLACKQYRIWQEVGIAPNRIAINISSREFMQENFVEDFLKLLFDTGVDPDSIELEITESLLLNIPGHVNASLGALRKQGVHIAIDDFGTGYSSLSYLIKMPFDVLKIDRLFVAEIGKSSDKHEIVSVIVDLAHQLGKTVCAEGIENAEQLQFLKNCGCEVAQGYLLSKPLSIEDYEQFAFKNKQ
jgi:diguanylate cyclase (GGDEF)-like protein